MDANFDFEKEFRMEVICREVEASPNKPNRQRVMMLLAKTALYKLSLEQSLQQQ